MGGQRGFSYLGLMILIAIMGVGLAATGEIWATSRQRERESQLLYVGEQYRRALDRYYRNSPVGAPRYPQQLAELLRDPRFPDTRRYLRRLYPDPVTGKAEWGLVKGPAGEIVGIYSLSEAEPLKKAGFGLQDRGFEGKTKYAEWVFVHGPSRYRMTARQ